MQLVGFLLIFLFSCCNAAKNLPEGVYYISLDSAANISLFWSFNYDQKYVKFEIHLPLRKWDWFAIGFSNYGELYPADFCVLWTNYQWQTVFQDFWTDDIGNLHLDDSQDCENFDINYDDGTKFTFTRKFDTCDNSDYIIEDGTTHIVWMKGTGLISKMTDLNVNHAMQNGMQRTQLLKSLETQKIKKPRNTRIIEFKTDNVKVPSADTTYWCRVMRIPEFLLKTHHHVIEFESVIQSGNEGLVHHIEIFHCEAPKEKKISSYNGPCVHPDRPKDTEVCKKVLAAWAMGATPFRYPKEAGLLIGGDHFNPYVILEVHYNNPEMKEDYVDSSGIKLYVTSSLRKFDAGVIELGLEYTDKMAIPPQQESFILSGYCISECTAVSIPAQGIIIFGSQLHTHLTGAQVLTRHIRDGRELPELNQDNHYSTHFQEIRLLKRPVKVLPGDALITTCRYNTLKKDNITLGGFRIKDEMCINYVYYYPKIDLEVCKSSISYQTLFTYFRYMNEWEYQNTDINGAISENYGNIEWNSKRAKDLQILYDDMTLSMQCNASTGLRFPGDWENVPLTHVLYSLPPPVRSCKQNEIIT